MGSALVTIGPVVLFAAGLAIIAMGAYLVFLYNGLIYLTNQRGKAWANIDVLLKQRHDLIPNLVETVKGYAVHEKATFEGVAQARAAASTLLHRGQDQAPNIARAEEQLTVVLKSLLAVAEAYPNLKANESFMGLQRTLVQIENEIAERREFYNDSVNLYNNAIQRLPDVLIARLLRYDPALYFRADDADRAPIDVGFDR